MDRLDTYSFFLSFNIHILGTEYNIALLTNKTIYSIFKIVFCVIIHITLITQYNETDIGNTITERIVQDNISRKFLCQLLK